MDIILGLGTAGAAVLMFCWAYGAHRRPVRLRWTTMPGLSMLTCVALTMMAPLAVGFVVKGALNVSQTLESFRLDAALAAIALCALAFWFAPVLIRPARAARPPKADNRNRAPSAPSVDIAA